MINWDDDEDGITGEADELFFDFKSTSGKSAFSQGVKFYLSSSRRKTSSFEENSLYSDKPQAGYFQEENSCQEEQQFQFFQEMIKSYRSNNFGN